MKMPKGRKAKCCIKACRAPATQVVAVNPCRLLPFCREHGKQLAAALKSKKRKERSKP